MSSTGEGGALSSPPPFNLRDKYKLHLEEENYTAKYYIGDSEKSRKTEREIPRATWEV